MFDFPNTPTTGQQFTPAGGPTYQWNGTGWTLLGAPTAGMLAQTVFTYTGSTQTYTPTPGMQTAIIECVGGGGGGSGVGATTGGYSTGSGGGSGSYSRKFVTAAQVGTSQVVTIGTAGAGAATGGNVGGAGGDTSVGSLCVGKGARVTNNNFNPGLGGVLGTGDIIAAGSPGQPGANSTTGSVFLISGNGASSIYGGGANLPLSNNNGINATNYGAGGSGGYGNSSASTFAGGNGSPGIVIITEYANVAVGSVGSGLNLLATMSASNSATIDFIGLLTGAFDEYEVHYVDVLPVASNNNLSVLIGQSGIIQTAASYRYALNAITDAGVNSPSGGTAAGGIPLTPVSSVSNSATNVIAGRVKIFRPASSGVYKNIMHDTTFLNVTPSLLRITGGGMWSGNTNPIDSLRFQMGSGNISSGTFKLYGVK